MIGKQELDFEETRALLYVVNHKETLELFDRVFILWQERESSSGGLFRRSDLMRALRFAAMKHRGHFRKSKKRIPYLNHLLDVVKILWEEGQVYSENILMAALLHDSIEDTETSEEEIFEAFGYRVLYSVLELTNDPNLHGFDLNQSQLDKAAGLSLDGRLIKLADRISNLRSCFANPPSSWSKERISEYFSWSEKLLRELYGSHDHLERVLFEELVRQKEL